MSCPMPGRCRFDRSGNGTDCAAEHCAHLRLIRMALGEEIQALCAEPARSETQQRRLEELKARYADTLRRIARASAVVCR